jgi:hypothetical protein
MITAMRLITNIVWCIDNEYEFDNEYEGDEQTSLPDNLPTEVYVPINYEEDEIADYLSDRYGFLVETFQLN